MAEVKVKHPYIARKSGVQGGRSIIAGTRILVSNIIIYYKEGKDVDEILELYPHLSPAQIYAALSYYYDYQEEIEKEVGLIQDETRWQRQYPPGKGRRVD